jgi:predicted nucleotidyltransferase
MKKLVEKICNDITKKYQQDKNVLGIMLFGSAARDKLDQYSDIDIFILLNKKGKFSRFNFIKNGTRIDIIFNTKKEIKDYLSRDKYGLKRITSHMLANGKILYDNDNYLLKFQRIAKKNLESQTRRNKEDILMHKYSIDDFWGEVQRDVKNKNYLAFGIDSQLLMNNIIELFLRTKREFLRQPNEMLEFLNKVDKNFAQSVNNFYKTEKIKKKLSILSSLIKYAYKRSGGELPKNWKIK